MNEIAHPRSDADVLAAVDGQTVARLFRATVEARPDDPALRWKTDDGWASWTWADYADRALRTAALLRDLGVAQGDRVAIMMRNRPEFHAIDMGASLVGATPFSVYNSSSPEQIAYLIGHSDATVVFTEPDFAKGIEAVRDELPQLQQIIELAQWEARIEDVAPVDFAEAAAIATPDDLATFIYTSGTTGPPKAVMLSQRNICWLLESLVQVMNMPLRGARMLSYLPMAHVAERMWTHYMPAREGACVTTCPDPAAVAAYLPEVRPEAFFGPPRIFEKTRAALIAAVPHWRDADEATFGALRQRIGLDACRIALTGAAPPPVEVMEFFNFIGVPLFEVYGLSEDTGLMTLEVAEPRLGSVGRPIPGCTVRLEEDGEILCRGGHVFSGYFKDAEKSAEALDADGWLHTGDIGTIDEHGYIRIVDRKKELIITAGGKNISPANIEALLKTIPLVGQACAIGDQRPYVTAVLTLDPDAAGQRPGASDDDLRAEVEQGVGAINERLSNVERVKKFVLLRDEWLPDSDVLTPTSKLKRRGVLARYAADIDALYDGPGLA